MIRLANEMDFTRELASESALRICALKRAYGLDVPFIRFFADEEGSIAAVMDGFCVAHFAAQVTEEWCIFFRMNPDIHTIHSDEPAITFIANKFQLPYECGLIWRLENASSENTLQETKAQDVPLRDLYRLLSDVFDDMTPFDGWYVDVSHRVRHGCCHIAIASEDTRMVSAAMTVAETETAALIGGVATLPDYRRRGAASRCIRDLIAALPQKELFIAPSDDDAARLYKTFGFVPWGTWAELSLPQSGG